MRGKEESCQDRCGSVGGCCCCPANQPTKTSPKKYDPAVHGIKDTYTTYKLTPDEDLEVPAPSPYFDALLRPPPTTTPTSDTAPGCPFYHQRAPPTSV
ncbi:hypothetical protein Pmani_025315 [Petrolisthes manimaculis]|uniref:Uncharacterized protein n=1 Tax=Petrolisthes manimaculis TaxID=1843537 RepID=A0AAE1U1A1_9EUCA|nr:hypothetical protein Pmani_025315 [Petrolisthes manimaculis]